MKSGKYVKLSKKSNIAISYGSVNTKQLKSIYLRLQCWVEPKDIDGDWETIISRIRREVRMCAYRNIDNKNFTENYIVDLDLRSSGILLKKRSFLSCEITLFTKQQTDIRSKEFSSLMQGLADGILSSSPTLFNEFNIYERKR